MRARATSLLFVTLLGGCAIPSRDNAHDPQNAPSAVLAIVDQTLLNAGCTQADAADDAPEVFVARRVDCLALDASASEDPNGDSLHYAFFEGPATTPFYESSSIAIAVLGSAALATIPTGDPLTFRVVVSDGDASSEAQASVILGNSPPIARSDALRLRPVVAGAPDYVVTFDAGETTDPDGQPLEFCWTYSDLPGTRECGPRETHATRTRNLAAGVRRTVVARLEVTDPDGETAVARSPFRIGDPSVWVAPSAGANPIVRIDANREVIPGFGLAPQVAILGTNLAISHLGAGYEIQALTGSGPTPVGTPLAFAASSASVFADPPRQRYLSLVDSSLGLVLSEWTLEADGSIDPGASTLLDASTSVFLQNFATALVDSSDAIWVARQAFGNELWRVEGDLSAWTRIPPAADRLFTGFGTRPGRTETWVTETYDYQTPQPVLSGPARLLVFRDGSTTPDAIETPHSLLNGFGWVDEFAFWTFSAEEGLVLVDADAAADPLVGFDGAILLRFPDLLDVQSILVEPGTGVCWTQSLADFTYKATPDGELTTYQSSLPAVLTIDAQGAVYYTSQESDGFQLRHGQTTDAQSRVGSAIYFQYGSTAPDLLTGGVWVASIGPNRLIHLDPDATVDRSRDRLMLDGVETAMPALFPLRLAPDGVTAWAVTRDFPDPSFFYAPLTLIRIDLSTEIPTATTLATVDDGILVPGGGSSYRPMIEPGRDGSGNPFAWAYDSAGKRIVRVRDGGITEAHALDPANSAIQGAASAITSALCSVSVANGIVELRYQGADAATSQLLDSRSVASVFLEGTAVSHEDGEDVCWFLLVIDGETRLESWTLSGETHPAVTLATAFSVLAASHDEVYVGSPRRRIEWPAGGGPPVITPIPGAVPFGEVLVGVDSDY